MDTKLLSGNAFRSYFSLPMRNVTADAEPGVDIWPYVDAIPIEELEGMVLRDVEIVYRDAVGRFDLVNIATDHYQVFMVVVVDLVLNEICGHHLLNLPHLYGVDGRKLDG